MSGVFAIDCATLTEEPTMLRQVTHGVLVRWDRVADVHEGQLQGLNQRSERDGTPD